MLWLSGLDIAVANGSDLGNWPAGDTTHVETAGKVAWFCCANPAGGMPIAKSSSATIDLELLCSLLRLTIVPNSAAYLPTHNVYHLTYHAMSSMGRKSDPNPDPNTSSMGFKHDPNPDGVI